jgi:hypothetical protein
VRKRGGILAHHVVAAKVSVIFHPLVRGQATAVNFCQRFKNQDMLLNPRIAVLTLLGAQFS